MRLLRSPWTRAFLVWTVILLAASIVVFFHAVLVFLRAADACFFGTGPCSRVGDADLFELQVAVFGVPLIWLVGVLLGAVGRALARRRRTAAP